MGCGASSNPAVANPQAQPSHRRPLDDVELGKMLGKGSFALCRQGSWGEDTVAVKELRKSDRLFERKLVENEIMILKRLSHPSCVKLLDVREDCNSVYLVQEILHGGHLGDRICRRTRLCEAEAAVITLQLLEAVSYLHSEGVCHRDLKPENILMCSTLPESSGYNKIKITDFGLSFYGETEGYPIHNMSSVRGTPQFAAPEVLARASGDDIEYDRKIDIYSVGLMLFIMLGGRHPFAYDGAGVKEVMNRIMEGRYEFGAREFRGVSEDALRFIEHMMELVPASRPNAEQCLQNGWLAMAQTLACKCLQPAKSKQKSAACGIKVREQLSSPLSMDMSGRRVQEDFGMELQVGNDTLNEQNHLIDMIETGIRVSGTRGSKSSESTVNSSITESIVYNKDDEDARRNSCCKSCGSEEQRFSATLLDITRASAPLAI